MTYYIEDVLHFYVDSIGATGPDGPILTSISRQCKKGMALTDRQYDLVKNKLAVYKDVLQEHNIEFNNNPPRLPLREIDRSKYIRIVDTAEAYANTPYESYKESYKWIKVRFPFSKKDIVKIESVIHECINQRKRLREYRHVKGSHEHYFLYNAYTAYALVKALQNRNFDIDAELIDVHNGVQKLLENRKQHTPYVDNNKVVNLHQAGLEMLNEQIHEDSLTILKDRSHRFGYMFNDYVSNGTLVDTIVCRDRTDVLIDPQKYNINQIASALYELDRFPLVVIVDQENCCDQLLEIHRAFNYIVDNSQQSVLFRVDSDDKQNSHLNQYIKDHNLNNWVDKDTKIVYIKKNKLPKALLTSDFRPMAAFGKTSMRNNAQVDNYINFYCDLIVYHDNQENLFGKYSRRYGFL